MKINITLNIKSYLTLDIKIIIILNHVLNIKSQFAILI